MIDVPVDADARMNVSELRRILDRCLEEERPVYTVVAVIGSTEESAIDPIEDVLALREEFREKGLEFTVHADAAWGGYHASVVRDDILAKQPINPVASKHPFVEAGNRYFNALLWVIPNGNRAANMFICDATLWSAAFGGLESLEVFWQNLANLK